MQEAGAKFTAALASGDAQTAASFFTDDAVALPPGRAPITGKADIQRFLGNMTHAVKNLKYVPDDVKPIGDRGRPRGRHLLVQDEEQRRRRQVSAGLDEGRQRLEDRCRHVEPQQQRRRQGGGKGQGGGAKGGAASDAQ